ncbi:MAG: glycosyltransferase family 9 protein [Bacteroidota bacterium]|nr:glycosyltransferase family 9 protein [Bacteroidota bacterium]
MKKILIIQTASIGDVILATPIVEKIHFHYPKARIDFLAKDGCQSVLLQHPKIKWVLVWDKKHDKYKNLWELIKYFREGKYDLVINLQRFLSTGLITTFSGAKRTIGFSKNPMSIFFSKRVKHIIGEKDKYIHEVERNLSLVSEFSDNNTYRPKLYPSKKAFAKVSQYKTNKYICIAPASLWFTKQFPEERWIEFINTVPKDYYIYLLGAKNDSELCNRLMKNSKYENILNLAGKMNLLESAALMKDAHMNYVNDSAPLHLATSVNAKVTAIFCSTVPEFGFGPLSDDYKIIEVRKNLECRPCGLHGHVTCPKNHFDCAYKIDIKELTNRL